MLLDSLLPAHDFRERHETLVAAPSDVVRRAAKEWRTDESWLWRALLMLRGLGKPAGTLREWAVSEGFLTLAESDDEVVLGQVGRFWSWREREALVSPRTVEEFQRIDDPRCAVAVMNLRSEEIDPRLVRLSTETRVHALGPGARRSMRMYWLLIRPFSGLLRRSMLRGIKARAEATVAMQESPRDSLS